MSTPTQIDHHAVERELHSRTNFGFWLYLMTDLVLFASLFAAFAVLRDRTAGGPSGDELFSMPFVLTETVLLLTSSFTAGLAILAAQRRSIRQVLLWLTATFLLGAGFLGMELYEFAHLVKEGESWRENAFLSSFFTLVGTHGAHIFVGLLWISVLGIQIKLKGLTSHTLRRLSLFSLFWHFLDIVWIFLFTIVYLMGAL